MQDAESKQKGKQTPNRKTTLLQILFDKIPFKGDDEICSICNKIVSAERKTI